MTKQKRHFSNSVNFFYRWSFTLMEVIIAVALFSIMATGIIPVTLSIFNTVLHDQNHLKAHYYVQQGLEALRSIRDYDFNNLRHGTYGLSRVRGFWELYGAQETLGQYTRSVTINDIVRDNTCTISTHGDADTLSKEVTVTVSWESIPGIVSQQSATQYLTNWRNPGSCEEAGNFVLDLSSANLTSGGRRIEGILIQNIGPIDITIDKITAFWTNSSRMQEIKIGSAIVWKSVGDIGYPSGEQPSGTEINIEDFRLGAYSGWIQLDHFFFDYDITGSLFTIYFTMADGTVKYESIQF